MKSFTDIKWDEFISVVNDELMSSFVITKTVVPHMMSQKSGRIIFIATGLTQSPAPNFIDLATGKGGLVTFAKYVAHEMGPHGITANVVSPGMVLTEASQHIPEFVKEQMIAETPMKRIATPNDVARAVAFYADSENDFVTGTNTSVSGGLIM